MKKSGQKIVILTGAGISAESGLGTFRDAGGIWTKYPLEEVATPEGFARDPALVQAFYNARRKVAAQFRFVQIGHFPRHIDHRTAFAVGGFGDLCAQVVPDHGVQRRDQDRVHAEVLFDGLGVHRKIRDDPAG